MIELLAYQSRWPDEFDAIATGLRGVFGERALAVDHIGSTSVPGLASKDIIDVQITVTDLANADAGRPNQRYPLLVRDCLRAHPEAAAAYAETKRQLQHYHADDRMAYVTIKDPVCDVIMAAAERWASS